jgi:PilZ domain
MNTINTTSITPPYAERRRPRLHVSDSVEVLWGKREYKCKLRNITAEGAMLSGQFPVQKGDQVRMIFKPNDMKIEMHLTAKVIEVAGTVVSQFRVLFEDVSVHSKAVLRDYVIRHMPPRVSRSQTGVFPGNKN